MTDPDTERMDGLIVTPGCPCPPPPVQEPFLTTIILPKELGGQCHPIGAIFHRDLQKVRRHNGTGHPSCSGVPLSHMGTGDPFRNV